MRKLLGILGSILAIIIVFFLCWVAMHRAKVERDTNDADTRKCLAHLRLIEMAIVAALIDDTNVDIDNAISKVVSKEEKSFLRCRPDTNYWVAINPDARRWKSPVTFTNEISLYCAKPGASNLWIARSFAGDDLILSNRPAWNPPRLFDLEVRTKVTPHKGLR